MYLDCPRLKCLGEERGEGPRRGGTQRSRAKLKGDVQSNSRRSPAKVTFTITAEVKRETWTWPVRCYYESEPNDSHLSLSIYQLFIMQGERAPAK